jgi:hypothetical protein
MLGPCFLTREEMLIRSIIKGLYPNSTTTSPIPIASECVVDCEVDCLVDCEVGCEVDCLVVVPTLHYIVRGVVPSAVPKTEITVVVGINLEVVETPTDTDTDGPGIDGGGEDGGDEGVGDVDGGDEGISDDIVDDGDICKPFVTVAADQSISLSNSVIVV